MVDNQTESTFLRGQERPAFYVFSPVAIMVYTKAYFHWQVTMVAPDHRSLCNSNSGILTTCRSVYKCGTAALKLEHYVLRRPYYAKASMLPRDVKTLETPEAHSEYLGRRGSCQMGDTPWSNVWHVEKGDTAGVYVGCKNDIHVLIGVYGSCGTPSSSRPLCR